LRLVRADQNWRAFDSGWFAANQSRLVDWLNGRLGLLLRRKLGIRGRGLVIEVGTHHVLFEESGRLEGEFYTGPVIAQRIYFGLLPLWWGMHLWDLMVPSRWRPRLSFGYDILTAYPDRGRWLTTMDGIVLRSAMSETFSAIRSGAGTGAGTGAGYDSVYLHSSAIRSNEFSYLYRGILTFDTSPMGAGAVVSSAYLGIRLFNKFSYLGSTPLHVVQASPAANNNLVAADYGSLGSASAGNLPFEFWVPDVYNSINLNAYGLTLIDPAGISKLGLRLEWDRTGVFTGTWVAGTYTGYWYWTADVYDPGYAPKLVVTFSRPSRPMVIVVDS